MITIGPRIDPAKITGQISLAMMTANCLFCEWQMPIRFINCTSNTLVIDVKDVTDHIQLKHMVDELKTRLAQHYKVILKHPFLTITYRKWRLP
jgi:hypothetical protein